MNYSKILATSMGFVGTDDGLWWLGAVEFEFTVMGSITVRIKSDVNRSDMERKVVNWGVRAPFFTRYAPIPKPIPWPPGFRMTFEYRMGLSFPDSLPEPGEIWVDCHDCGRVEFNECKHTEGDTP